MAIGRRRRPLLGTAAVLATTLAALTVTSFLPASAESDPGYQTIWNSDVVPDTTADADTRPVELGVEFTSATDGWITAIEYYKSAENKGPKYASLYAEDGTLLARESYPRGATEGWQTVQLSQPVAVSAGQKYVAAYYAPAGRYADDQGVFADGDTVKNDSLTALRGVYSYDGGQLTDTWNASNYYVDVHFVPATDGSAPPSSTTSASPTTTTEAPTTTTAAPPTTTSAAPTTTTAAPTTTSAPATTTSSAPSGGGSLSLPKIPWEGGSSYWGKFSKASAAGWSDPNFFPVGVWWSGISSNAEVQYDKAAGLNFYVNLNPGTDYNLIQNNGMYWVGGNELTNLTPSSKNWVGYFLDDEVDGRYTPTAGFNFLNDLLSKLPNDGRFKYANYTSSILTYDWSNSKPDGQSSQNDAEKYVNGFTDAVSIDQYFYSVPQCSWTPYQNRYIVDISQASCRTASSYGKMMDALRIRDKADGKLQSLWNFIETVGDNQRVTAAQVQAAVMNSIIHEARGIMYFPQSFSGGCETGNAFRTAQYDPTGCAAVGVSGASAVNAVIKKLAPVLNTQSYQYSFGSGLDTMLKTYNGSAYVFAMAKDGGSGSRTFTLPAGVSGTSVEVVNENRTLPVSGGTFTDSFAAESSYHIYKINL